MERKKTSRIRQFITYMNEPVELFSPINIIGWAICGCIGTTLGFMEYMFFH